MVRLGGNLGQASEWQRRLSRLTLEKSSQRIMVWDHWIVRASCGQERSAVDKVADHETSSGVSATQANHLHPLGAPDCLTDPDIPALLRLVSLIQTVVSSLNHSAITLYARVPSQCCNRRLRNLGVLATVSHYQTPGRFGLIYKQSTANTGLDPSTALIYLPVFILNKELPRPISLKGESMWRFALESSSSSLRQTGGCDSERHEPSHSSPAQRNAETQTQTRAHTIKHAGFDQVPEYSLQYP
ncbi:hypothetical protein BDW69DRAFT_149717 [Aspergillus filifer]